MSKRVVVTQSEMEATRYIKTKLREYFGKKKYVWATRGTTRYNDGFYGDPKPTHSPTLYPVNRTNMLWYVKIIMDTEHFCDDSGVPLTGNELWDAAINAIASDLQFTRPVWF
jgi:type II secretory pathway component HofQ